MKTLSVEYINPFLQAAAKVLKGMCNLDAKIGRPYISDPISAEESLIIMIGLTGEMRGQVVISFTNPIALDIASKMMGMDVTTMDPLAKSAIGELGNMIMGNAATIFANKGIRIDITPPTIGEGKMTFSSAYAKNICIPLAYEEGKEIKINIAAKAE